MNSEPYKFRNVYPLIHQSFIEAGWHSMIYRKDGNGNTILKAKNRDGNDISISLPEGTEPGSHISDRDLLAIMAKYYVKPVAFSTVDFVMSYASGWGFHDSDKKSSLLEIRHPEKENQILYLNKLASGRNDVLLFVEVDAARIEIVSMQEIQNIFELGVYLSKHGWVLR